LNIGNVSEFAFDKKGHWLAYVIDARGQSGNGVHLRNMLTSVVISLDTAKAFYKSLAWTEKNDSLTVLKGIEDKDFEDKLYSVVGFSDFTARIPQKIVYDPKTDKAFPADMTISPNRAPQWTDDLSAFLFGIQPVKKKETKPAESEPNKDKPKPDAKDKKPEKETKDTPAPPKPDKDKPKPDPKDTPPSPPKPDKDKPKPDPKAGPEKEKPDLVIWHWMDDRLQSQQQVQAPLDKSFSFLSIYRIKEKKFLRLADDKLRRVTPAAKQRWAVGTDNQPYELMSNLDGKRFQDVYVVDLLTGSRRLALKKCRWYYNTSSDGTHLLYYEDGHFYTQEMATGKTYNITKDIPASFVNAEDDHNVAQPPIPPFGWVKDGVSVLLSDGWDVWNVPVHGGKAVNLTVDGKKDGVRYRRRFILDREERGMDLSRPIYFSLYGEWTKKAGFARLDPDKPGPQKLLWDDAEFSTLMKAKDADVFLYTRETHKDYPDYQLTDQTFQNPCRLTNAGSQQEKYLWSKGAMLVNYTGAKGTRLQGALFLPADYEENQRYPTIVYIYEKLSGSLHRYSPPAVSGFNRSVYTSNGYAVLMPDIVYQINDPGRSAVGCILPALEAAIATGVVDRDRVALHGHSWGGYQTAFVITQTDAFKAAVAGAPLTNLISMYSSIYWNTGSTNQPIFESSQGRFTSGYWENLEAFTRNSPVYYAQNVKTPLILLHNDKDGAVDWNQGIEYFNTLRRLRKPVVLLQYKGENHGLSKAANQKDYLVRMQEFFDHYLRDKPAPPWLKEGIPHLKLDEHLKERAK
jgi:dipeptidyl aminopeptidase/acylaminoacyl peptidase